MTNVVLCAGLCAGLASCASKDTGAASKDEVPKELGVSEDRKAVDELRKNVPDEIKKSNDRLAEMLNRWKVQKTEPNRLRELFNDEIRKQRVAIERRHKRERDDFSRMQTDKRKAFDQKQKEEREDFLSSHPPSDRRNDFRTKQSEERDRFNADMRTERDDFNARLKDEREAFEDDIKNRWTEFRQEYPEYTRNYNEMKKAEEKEREELRAHPKPYSGWPYKDATDAGGSSAESSGAGAPSGGPGSAGAASTGVTAAGGQGGNVNSDVNKGGNGWPSSDMSEFDQVKKSGH